MCNIRSIRPLVKCHPMMLVHFWGTETYCSPHKIATFSFWFGLFQGYIWLYMYDWVRKRENYFEPGNSTAGKIKRKHFNCSYDVIINFWISRSSTSSFKSQKVGDFKIVVSTVPYPIIYNPWLFLLRDILCTMQYLHCYFQIAQNAEISSMQFFQKRPKQL